MTDGERRVGERSTGPGGVPLRDPRDLVDAGPALRIEDSRHPGGPALDAEIGRRPMIFAPEEPASPADEYQRTRGARTDLAMLVLFIAGLFVLAGAVFYLNGTERADTVLTAAGAVLLVIGAAVLLTCLALRRAG